MRDPAAYDEYTHKQKSEREGGLQKAPRKNCMYPKRIFECDRLLYSLQVREREGKPVEYDVVRERERSQLTTRMWMHLSLSQCA